MLGGLNPGLRGAVFRRPDNLVRALAGDSYALHCRGNAALPGVTPPDLLTAVNLQGNTSYNATNVTPAEEPHSGSVLGFPALTFTSAAAKRLVVVGGTPRLNAVADNFTIVAAFKMNVAAAGSEFIFDIGDGGLLTGMTLFVDNSAGGTLYSRARTRLLGLQTAATAFSDMGSIHVAVSTLDAAGTTLELDNAAPILTPGAGGGLLNACDDVAIGGAIVAGFSMNVSMFEAIALRNAPAAVIANERRFLLRKYGV